MNNLHQPLAEVVGHEKTWVSVLIALLVVLIGSSAFAFYGLAPRHMWDGWSPGPAHMWEVTAGMKTKIQVRSVGLRDCLINTRSQQRLLKRCVSSSAKLDLRYLFLEDEIDKEKAKQIHEKILSLRTEISGGNLNNG